jgi:hypothetical protein
MLGVSFWWHSTQVSALEAAGRGGFDSAPKAPKTAKMSQQTVNRITQQHSCK